MSEPSFSCGQSQLGGPNRMIHCPDLISGAHDEERAVVVITAVAIAVIRRPICGWKERGHVVVVPDLLSVVKRAELV